MNLLSDIVTYIRRIIKSPSDATITDNLIIDYINRFWIMDVDARIQLFDLKTVYTFQTTPNVDQYNMPLYSVQTEPGAQTIGMYPVYQGLTGSGTKVSGINVPFYTQRSEYYNVWPNYVQPINPIGYGNGTAGPYTLTIPLVANTQPVVNQQPSGLLRGHVDITGIIATGVNVDPPVGSTLNLSIPTTSVNSAVYLTSTDATGANVVVADSGQFLEGAVNCGLLMATGPAPYGNASLGAYSTTSNVVNYQTGTIYVTFPVAIPAGQTINAQVYYYNPGLPRSMLFYNNCIVLRNVPETQYLVEADAYLSPAAFLNTNSAIPFGYMAEYIARGAARKILADTGDSEQFAFYEPLFREQEMLVWKRSQRQFTATRTQTIYGAGSTGQSQTGNNGSLGLT